MTSQAGPGPEPAGQSNKDTIVYMMESSDNGEDSDINPPTPTGGNCAVKDVNNVIDKLTNMRDNLKAVMDNHADTGEINQAGIDEIIQKDCAELESCKSLKNLEDQGRGSIRGCVEEVKENLTKIKDGTAQTHMDQRMELHNSIGTVESEVRLLSGSRSLK